MVEDVSSQVNVNVPRLDLQLAEIIQVADAEGDGGEADGAGEEGNVNPETGAELVNDLDILSAISELNQELNLTLDLQCELGRQDDSEKIKSNRASNADVERNPHSLYSSVKMPWGGTLQSKGIKVAEKQGCSSTDASCSSQGPVVVVTSRNTVRNNDKVQAKFTGRTQRRKLPNTADTSENISGGKRITARTSNSLPPKPGIGEKNLVTEFIRKETARNTSRSSQKSARALDAIFMHRYKSTHNEIVENEKNKLVRNAKRELHAVALRQFQGRFVKATRSDSLRGSGSHLFSSKSKTPQPKLEQSLSDATKKSYRNVFPATATGTANFVVSTAVEKHGFVSEGPC